MSLFCTRREYRVENALGYAWGSFHVNSECVALPQHEVFNMISFRNMTHSAPDSILSMHVSELVYDRLFFLGIEAVLKFIERLISPVFCHRAFRSLIMVPAWLYLSMYYFDFGLRWLLACSSILRLFRVSPPKRRQLLLRLVSELCCAQSVRGSWLM